MSNKSKAEVQVYLGNAVIEPLLTKVLLQVENAESVIKAIKMNPNTIKYHINQ